MRAKRYVAILTAIVVPMSVSAEEEIVVEGTISVGNCGMLPPLPVCVIRDDAGGHEYALLDVNGDGATDVTDMISCLTTFTMQCLHRARVRGYLDWLVCDPIEGFGMDAIHLLELVAIDPGPACGDVNGSGAVDISDPIRILDRLFTARDAFLCPGVSDVNGDGGLDISDAVFLLASLFLGGPAPRCT